ncbi:hypothetical protein SAMN05421693_1042 [Ectothiorhodospira magna]|uniref:Uncharacterized protein n=1 Tax=Ectothiorhodospira magna TaxID=867345 RepID=A0A1H9A398_9GAMM|nr:hypothetical protein SAMN05421693_1042 [Ectothiorhodospira magna]
MEALQGAVKRLAPLNQQRTESGRFSDSIPTFEKNLKRFIWYKDADTILHFVARLLRLLSRRSRTNIIDIYF